MRIVLLAAAIPVAIIANAARVAASTCVSAFDAGTPHEMLGVVIFAFSLAAILPIQRLFHSVYIRYHA